MYCKFFVKKTHQIYGLQMRVALKLRKSHGMILRSWFCKH